MVYGRIEVKYAYIKKLIGNLKYVVVVSFLLIACSSSARPIEPAISGNPVTTINPGDLPASVNRNDTVNGGIQTKWELWSEGKTHLRGANIWQSLVITEVDGDFKGTGYTGPPFSQEDFNHLAEWGANYLVLSVPGIFTEKPPYQLDKKSQESLDRLLDMAAKADLFVTIAFRTGPGRAEWSLCCAGDEEWQGYFNDTVWTDLTAQQAWADMWKTAAERYRERPEVVGYELMVEPNGEDILLDIWNAEDFFPKYTNSSYDWNQFYPKIVNAIRQVDKETPIIVGGASYSRIGWLPYLQPVKDSKIVYDIHQYEPVSAYTHQQPGSRHGYPGRYDIDTDGTVDDFNLEWLMSQYQIVKDFSNKNQAAISINEFGVIRSAPDAAKFIQDQMEIIETNGWNHAVWQWSSTFKPFCEVVTDFNFRLGPDPDNKSKDIQNELADVIKSYWQKNSLQPSLAYWNK
jgi:hypothetical protein